MRNKKIKVKFSEQVKEQIRKMPEKDLVELSKTLKQIKQSVKDKTIPLNTMSLFSPPSAEELRNWTSEINPSNVDLVLEYLHDKNCLTKEGTKLAGDFWERYIKEEKI